LNYIYIIQHKTTHFQMLFKKFNAVRSKWAALPNNQECLCSHREIRRRWPRPAILPNKTPYAEFK